MAHGHKKNHSPRTFASPGQVRYGVCNLSSSRMPCTGHRQALRWFKHCIKPSYEIICPLIHSHSVPGLIIWDDKAYESKREEVLAGLKRLVDENKDVAGSLTYEQVRTLDFSTQDTRSFAGLSRLSCRRIWSTKPPTTKWTEGGRG